MGNGVYGKQMKLEHIDDEQVRKAFEFRVPIEYEHDFSDTLMLTPEFTKAYTWAFPLLAGHDLIGVIKLENLHISMRELYSQQPAFFTYAASVLKNEIHSQTRLKQANTQLREMNNKLELEIVEREQVEEELQHIRDKLEERVYERTTDLYYSNERLQHELVERKRAEDFLHKRSK